MIKFEDLKVGMKIISTKGYSSWDGVKFPITIAYVGKSTIAYVGSDGNEDVRHSSGYYSLGNYIVEYKEPVITKSYVNFYTNSMYAHSFSSPIEARANSNTLSLKDRYKYTIEITETDGVPTVKVLTKDELKGLS